ncbi:MAG: hypothetical protein ABWY06_13755 [Pseudomonas sp.]|uniref:hypothetical protein n=1 Tax=Pseudomonas sp. TaxID=306 RepID=UPI003392B9BC
MKLIACIAIGLLVSYATLILASEHLGAISSTVCGQEFVLPDIVCRLGGGILTLLLVPISGILAFFGARRTFAKP